ncbi:MAG: T9SS type A sorting domain-containing protein [Flavobacteriales bacterium]
MNRLLPVLCSLLLITSSNAQSGANDPSFDPGTGADNGHGIILDIALQPDGKMVLVGLFNGFDDGTGQNIVRINSDGSRDAGFDVGYGTGSSVSVVAIQNDGKVLIGGHFYGYPGSTGLNDLMRLNSDGSFDTGFDSGDGAYPGIGEILVLPDNKILIAGLFTEYWGVPRNHIARMNADGSLDPSFDPGAGATSQTSSSASTIALQPDGKIILAGQFTAYDGTPRKCIARLNSDGSLDNSFDAGAGPVASGYDDRISKVVLQPDGKILVIGNFYTFNGVDRNYIARLNADGSLDTSFDPGSGANLFIRSVALQTDGKIVIGGSFTEFNGVSENRFMRLNADGSKDASFDTGSGPDDPIGPMVIQDDGKIVIGGAINFYDGASRNGIARVLVEPTIGIEEVASGPGLQVMPNPATNRLYVTGIQGGFQWSIFNLQGSLLMEGSSRRMLEQGIDISSLAPGSYMLRATDGALGHTVRFNKLR